MNAINFILQGKGGVGKTFISTIIAEFYQSQLKPFRAFDTDPVNSSFHAYKGLEVKKIPLFDQNKNVNSSIFDELIIKSLEPETDIVIDNGASTFVPLSQYLLQNGIPNLIHENGKEMIVHTVVVGGDMQNDTMSGLVTLVSAMPESVKIIVWLNEYFGEIQADGKPFEEFKFYQNNKQKIHAIIKVIDRGSDTFAADLKKKQAMKFTFDEGIKSEDFHLISKQRLKTIQREIFEQLNEVL